MRYPWQKKQWHHFWQSVQAGRLPHALLLTGMAGTGKSAFAKHAAQALLCQNVTPDGDPCDVCHACRLVKTDVHPNICQVSPEKEGHAIKVDQIRPLAEFVQQSSLSHGHRVVIIQPAHSMNINASNALLKTLEEPSSGAILILITEQSGHLPATIRSRCQRIIFPRPEKEEALKWLEAQTPLKDMTAEQSLRLAQGAPLLAAHLADDDMLPFRTEMFQSMQALAEKRANPLSLADKWQKIDPVKWLDLFLVFIADMMRLQLGGQSEQLTNQDHAPLLQACTHYVPLHKNLILLQYVMKVRGQLSAGINFNKQLLIESMLIRWSEPVK